MIEHPMDNIPGLSTKIGSMKTYNPNSINHNSKARPKTLLGLTLTLNLGLNKKVKIGNQNTVRLLSLLSQEDEGPANKKLEQSSQVLTQTLTLTLTRIIS